MNTKFLILIVLTLHLTSTIAAGGCPGVRSMTTDAACREASGTQLMYELCSSTLRAEFRDPRSFTEVTEYARVAARRAFLMYQPTIDVADVQCQNHTHPDEDRAAFCYCHDAAIPTYYGAKVAMSKVKSWLADGCWFDGLHDQYMTALLDLERCRDRVIKIQPEPEMYSMILDDRNRTFLAYILGKLLGVE
ncbi:hypothetical protein ACP70R_003501 [Stipagrostis hirtigluma subsp. patula]